MHDLVFIVAIWVGHVWGEQLGSPAATQWTTVVAVCLPLPEEEAAAHRRSATQAKCAEASNPPAHKTSAAKAVIMRLIGVYYKAKHHTMGQAWPWCFELSNQLVQPLAPKNHPINTTKRSGNHHAGGKPLWAGLKPQPTNWSFFPCVIYMALK